MNDFPRCRQRKSVSLSCSEESGVVCGGVVGAFVPGVRRVAPGVGPVSPVKGSVKALPGDSGVLPKPLPRDSGPLTSRPSAQIHIYIYRCFFTLRYPRYISPCLIMTYPGTPSPTPPEIYILPWDHAPPLATAHGVPVPCTPDRRKLVSLPLKVPLKAPLKAPRAPPRAQLASAPARHVAAHTHRPQLASFPPVTWPPSRSAARALPLKLPLKTPRRTPPPVSLRPADARPQPSQVHPANWVDHPPLAKGSAGGITLRPAGRLARAWARDPGVDHPPRSSVQRTVGPETHTHAGPESPSNSAPPCPHPVVPSVHPPRHARASRPGPGPSGPILPLYIPSDPLLVRNSESPVKVDRKFSKIAV